MALMKFTAHIGKSQIASGRGYMRALHAILENAETLVETGTAYIKREDGVVVARIDLDVAVPDGRHGPRIFDEADMRKAFEAGWDAFAPHNNGDVYAPEDEERHRGEAWAEWCRENLRG